MSRPVPDQVFLVDEAVAHRVVEGQVLLLLPDEYTLYTLNPSGKLVWEELVKGRPLAAMVARLARAYRIPAQRAEEDVLALLADLEARGVIRRA